MLQNAMWYHDKWKFLQMYVDHFSTPSVFLEPLHNHAMRDAHKLHHQKPLVARSQLPVVAVHTVNIVKHLIWCSSLVSSLVLSRCFRCWVLECTAETAKRTESVWCAFFDVVAYVVRWKKLNRYKVEYRDSCSMVWMDRWGQHTQKSEELRRQRASRRT